MPFAVLAEPKGELLLSKDVALLCLYEISHCSDSGGWSFDAQKHDLPLRTGVTTHTQMHNCLTLQDAGVSTAATTFLYGLELS